LTEALVRINAAYEDLYYRTERRIITWGGRRSGKSWAVSQLLVRRALEFAPRRILILRKVNMTSKYSTWPRIQAAVSEVVPLQYCKVNKSELSITLPNGSVFFCLGLDDSEKLKSMEGVTDVWWEEATEFTEMDYDTVDAGLSAISDWPNQHWMTFNPLPRIPGHQHWIEKRFLNRTVKTGQIDIVPELETVILHTTFLHNAMCPLDVVRTLKSYKDTNPNLYKLWAEGLFSEVEGVILTGWEVVDSVPEGVPFYGYGLDFGYANDPAALVAVWMKKDEIYVQEMVYSTGLINSDLAEEMKKLKISGVIKADCAEPKSIDELRRFGFNVHPSQKGADYKRYAAQWLQGRKLKIIQGSANLIKEAASWSWERTRQGNILPRPADGNDHLIDALIYATWTGDNIDIKPIGPDGVRSQSMQGIHAAVDPAILESGLMSEWGLFK
jgi:phage terminase large subunit